MANNNIVVVGGVKVVEMVEQVFDKGRYNIVKSHKFVEDAFIDIMDNTAEYLDVNDIVVLQYGIKDNIDKEKQIRELQEIASVRRLNAKMHFILNELELYNNLENTEDASGPIIYKNAKIHVLDKLYNKSIFDIIEGKMDDTCLKYGEDEVLEEYEEDFGLEEIDEEDKIFVSEDKYPKGERLDAKKEDVPVNKRLDDIRNQGKKPKVSREKKSGFGLFGKDASGVERPKKETGFKGVERDTTNVGNSYSSRGNFSGVLAVTGDRNSGVSTTASLLAETYAQVGKTVLIIDLDFLRRYQSLIYPEFNHYEEVMPRTQMGVYYALNNTQSIEDLIVIVKENVALLGNNRRNEYYSSPFVESSLESLVNPTRLSTLVGVAKGIFDIVILDFPLEQIFKLLESSIIVDKFVLCVENHIHSLDNLFNITFASRLDDGGEIYIDSMLSKSCVVLTRYSSHNKEGRSELTEQHVENILRNNVHPKIEVVGKISYSNVYSQIGGKKSPIELHDVTRGEFRDIIAKI